MNLRNINSTGWLPRRHNGYLKAFNVVGVYILLWKEGKPKQFLYYENLASKNLKSSK